MASTSKSLLGYSRNLGRRLRSSRSRSTGGSGHGPGSGDGSKKSGESFSVGVVGVVPIKSNGDSSFKQEHQRGNGDMHHHGLNSV